LSAGRTSFFIQTGYNNERGENEKANMKILKNKPSYLLEKRLLARYACIAGVDEAGVGPLAGPVVAAAVILEPADVKRGRASWWRGVRDSKMLSHKARERYMELILQHAASFGIGSASVSEIDEINILQARLLAMKRAVENLKTVPHRVLVDGNIEIPDATFSQECIVRGDAKVLSIACASILAKVTRDNILMKLHEQFPEYGFAQHKGYPTALHRQRLKQYGPCSEHRKSFAPVKKLLKADWPHDSLETAESVVFLKQ
jgi:ribonuclease HII